MAVRARKFVAPARPIRLAGVNDWQRGKKPKDYAQRCYPTKEQALHAFADHNHSVIEACNGLTHEGGGPAAFDAVNEKYGLKDKKKVKSIAQALWHALPSRGPFCLDKVDLAVLNDMHHAESCGAYTLPEAVVVAKYEKQEKQAQRRKSRKRDDDAPMRDDFYEPAPSDDAYPRVKPSPDGFVGKFCEKTLSRLRQLHPKSLRWKSSGKAWVLVGCPKKAWRPIKKRCRVAVKAYKLLAPPKTKHCPRGTKSVEKNRHG